MIRPLTFVLGVMLSLLCFKSPSAGAEAASADEAQQTAAAVFHLFETKCNDCHGAHLEKPKGKFGYLMDFKKIAANEDMVVLGEPSKSELFRLVNEDEMPGEKSDLPPATAAEKLALRRWIQIGAPSDLPLALEEKRLKLLEKRKLDGPELSEKVGAVAEEGAKVSKPFLSRLLSWFGKFHAASTHFPVGLLSVAVLSEFLGWLTKRPAWLVCTRFLLVLGAGSAGFTAALGWLNDYSGVSAVYAFHKWMGTATALWAVLSAGNALFFECREGTMERNRLRVTILVGALLVSGAGFLGGAITFGLDHYRW